ncbi:MAG: sensor histidine kinase, partial [Proteobacteria bacterium]|nr:sensor histidine kinase [Pseudomonadota bacterium]
MPPARDQAIYEQNISALKPFHRRSPGLCRTALWGVVVPALCTLVFWPLRHAVGPSSILLTYLLGVFLVATRHGRGASITASFVSAAAFAFFFAPPIYSLAMTDVENVIGLGVMLAVAHVTSRMLERTRVQAEIAARREAHATMLYRLSHALAEATDEEQIIEIAEQHILGDFGATSALLVSDREGRLS